MAWVNFDELPSAAGHIFHIAGKSGFGRDLDLHAETDNRFHFFVARGAPNTLRSTTVVESGRWYRVAATYRADDVIALYVNGKLEAQRGIPGIDRLPNVGPLSVGENFAFPGRKLHGRIDEVSFWSRALSEAEVAALWRAPARKEPGLEAAYRLDGNARDSSSHGLHGQLVGGARYVGPGAPRAEARPVAAPLPVEAGRPTTKPDAGAPAPLPPGSRDAASGDHRLSHNGNLSRCENRLRVLAARGTRHAARGRGEALAVRRSSGVLRGDRSARPARRTGPSHVPVHAERRAGRPGRSLRFKRQAVAPHSWLSDRGAVPRRHVQRLRRARGGGARRSSREGLRRRVGDCPGSFPRPAGLGAEAGRR